MVFILLYHFEDFSCRMEDGKEERGTDIIVRKRNPPSIRTLSIKALSGVTSLHGLSALGPASESVDPYRTRKLSKEVYFSEDIRCKPTKTETNFRIKNRR
ncbi:hypothetical protein AVEN_138129-1 [Araneus ventricosus]|uniref:Uncharacterized protein n=1 Tax=Araneus ventricosus TaxID=182803 RepID=A0A4Y2F9C9_ARAVE|nr:hypothetical protein AVEN_138129-1 [Araneus ventricosus]